MEGVLIENIDLECEGLGFTNKSDYCTYILLNFSKLYIYFSYKMRLISFP